MNQELKRPPESPDPEDKGDKTFDKKETGPTRKPQQPRDVPDPLLDDSPHPTPTKDPLDSKRDL